mmetsp:Transcript_15132/g.14539  ORF Transcript_15132/g.14539 Transcript_15132/m.14539 type:complete len:432 (-) Transcript_15132:205-1500(-)
MSSLWNVCTILTLCRSHMTLAQLHLSQKVSFDTATAFEFLDRMQEPANCSGREYAIAHMGVGGGFASQFQMTAKNWWKKAAAYNYTIPVLARGHIRGYSEGKECHHVKGDLTCFFLPSSKCQEEMLISGKLLPEPTNLVHRIEPSAMPILVPLQFVDKGLAWWWGVIQARMFRMQPTIENYIKEEIRLMKKMNGGRGFPFGAPVAGLHVRHGDKSTDGFKDQSFEAEIEAINKSPECSQVDRSANSTVECLTNSESNLKNINSYDLKINDRNDSNINNTTSALEVNSGIYKQSYISDSYSSGKITVFVASDDAAVLVSARKMGHLVDSSGSGVSQQNKNQSMESVLSGNNNLGYNASLEIITDMYFLSQCTTLVGIAASQVFRTVVGISNATGLLRAAIVMDYHELLKVKRLSDICDVPNPEIFMNSKARS